MSSQYLPANDGPRGRGSRRFPSRRTTRKWYFYKKQNFFFFSFPFLLFCPFIFLFHGSIYRLDLNGGTTTLIWSLPWSLHAYCKCFEATTTTPGSMQWRCHCFPFPRPLFASRFSRLLLGRLLLSLDFISNLVLPLFHLFIPLSPSFRRTGLVSKADETTTINFLYLPTQPLTSNS